MSLVCENTTTSSTPESCGDEESITTKTTETEKRKRERERERERRAERERERGRDSLNGEEEAAF